MTITKRTGFFFFLFFSALISCKKKDNDIIIEGQYKPSTTTEFDEVIMYSYQGQIKETAVIKDFLNKKNLVQYFTFDKKTENTADYTASYIFDFANNNTVNTSTRSLSTPSKAEIVERTSTYLDLAAVDSIQINSNTSTNRCQDLQSTMLNPNPQKKLYAVVPTASGYSSIYKYRPMMRLEIINNQLYLPIVTYMTSVNAPGEIICVNLSEGSHATFNNAILQQLKPQDTIMYQIKRVQLIKQ